MDKTSMKNRILAATGLDAADKTIIDSGLENFCAGVIAEIDEDMTLTFDAADFGVDKGSFLDSTGSPLQSGQGTNAAFSLTGKAS